jgi:hypothetical protein
LTRSTLLRRAERDRGSSRGGEIELAARDDEFFTPNGLCATCKLLAIEPIVLAGGDFQMVEDAAARVRLSAGSHPFDAPEVTCRLLRR